MGIATTKLSQNLTRLSSGLRINKPADDAAGLAVSSLLTIDQKVATQGVRNLNDGASYLNVAESALSELSNIVTRISELAEQSANGTIGTAQRDALQTEVTALKSEYNRIIESTSFNNKQLLTGDYTVTTLQGGYGIDGQLTIQIGDTAGELYRASVSSTGDESNLTSSNTGARISISGDGRYVAFKSLASNLVSGDTNGFNDIFVRDNLLGTVTLASVDNTGTGINNPAHGPSLSANGEILAYLSSASDIVTGDLGGFADVFVRNLVTGTNEMISVSSAGVQGDAESGAPSVSADGRFVAFTSDATNLVAGPDTNGALINDLYLRDRFTNTTTRISVDDSGNQGDGTNILTDANAVSADGRYVLFSSNSTNLVSGDTNGLMDIFVRDTLLNTTTRVNVDSSGTEATGGNSSSGSISADGRYVSFYSTATNLVSGDTNGTSDVFIRDMLLGTTTRVSTDANGAEATGGDSQGASLSADGIYISFKSAATNLVSGDTNGITDMFVKNIESGEIRRVNTDNNGVEADGQSYTSALSADGRYIVFDSDATNLVSNDNNGVGDIFIRDLSIAGVQKMGGMIVSNQASAEITLDLSRNYQDELSLYRSSIGAATSRISTFINTLSSAAESYTSAASQITDADIAEEAAGLVANRITQQVASSILAQANQENKLAVKLLTGI